jgi:hypothetical protein
MTKVNKKGKFHPKKGHEAPVMEDSYSCTICLTLALDEAVRSTPRPGRFTAEKETWYSFYRRLRGPESQSGRVWKISPPTGIQSLDRPGRIESPYRLKYGVQEYRN